MPNIISLQELDRVAENARKQQASNAQTGQIEIILTLGTAAIALGAYAIQKAILDFIRSQELSNVVVRQTGGIGWDSMEPIIQVQIPEQQIAIYGKVTPEKAARILQEHIVSGQTVQDLLVSF